MGIANGNRRPEADLTQPELVIGEA